MEAASFKQHIIMEYNIKAVKQSNFAEKVLMDLRL
jgi:hypothetical protein